MCNFVPNNHRLKYSFSIGQLAGVLILVTDGGMDGPTGRQTDGQMNHRCSTVDKSDGNQKGANKAFQEFSIQI